MTRMQRKYIGSVLLAFGLGMIMAYFIPFWGVIAAIAVAAVGVYLILNDDC